MSDSSDGWSCIDYCVFIIVTMMLSASIGKVVKNQEKIIESQETIIGNQEEIKKLLPSPSVEAGE